jgi:hypothetical protein
MCNGFSKKKVTTLASIKQSTKRAAAGEKTGRYAYNKPDQTCRGCPSIRRSFSDVADVIFVRSDDRGASKRSLCCTHGHKSRLNRSASGHALLAFTYQNWGRRSKVTTQQKGFLQIHMELLNCVSNLDGRLKNRFFSLPLSISRLVCQRMTFFVAREGFRRDSPKVFVMPIFGRMDK